MAQVIQWGGRDWMRRGACNRCGECCAGGWREPCPAMAIQADATVECRIYRHRDSRDDPQVLAATGVRTTACCDFPRDPGDLLQPAVRNRCGYWFEEVPKLLVACPTHESKEYAWAEWAARVKTLTYPNYDILVADNSPTRDFSDRHGSEVEIIHLSGLDPRPEAWLERICRSMEAIQGRFLAGGYAYWMNIEADVIPPAGVIEALLRHKSDWAAHRYPVRGGTGLEAGIGCSLLSRRLMEAFDWKTAHDSPDMELWRFVSASGRYSTVEVSGVLDVAHRSAP